MNFCLFGDCYFRYKRKMLKLWGGYYRVIKFSLLLLYESIYYLGFKVEFMGNLLVI